MSRSILLEKIILALHSNSKNISSQLYALRAIDNETGLPIPIFITKHPHNSPHPRAPIPCDVRDCDGRRHYSRVCPSCAEARAGYTSRWTCDMCGSRILKKG